MPEYADRMDQVRRGDSITRDGRHWYVRSSHGVKRDPKAWVIRYATGSWGGPEYELIGLREDLVDLYKTKAEWDIERREDD